MIYFPKEILQQIYEFCIDKRLNWDKLTQQYLKGGFNRKNLKLNMYLPKQNWCLKKIWRAARPEISGGMTRWNPVTLKNEICPFDYRHGGWDIKKKQVIVTFETGRGLRNKSSAKDPVSRCLKNIKRFETAYPEFAKKDYLPNIPSPIKVNGMSEFYVNLRAHNKIKRKREKEKKAATLFLEERKQLKLNNCNFKTRKYSSDQCTSENTVSLSFTMPSGKLKFYKGYITRIYLHQHRRGNGYRKIFSAPRGKNRFDMLTVDCYIGEVRITVTFEDGESRQYSIERLTERIQTSAREKSAQEKKAQEKKAQEKKAQEKKAQEKSAQENDEKLEMVDEDNNSYLCEKIIINNITYFIMQPSWFIIVSGQNIVEQEIGLLNSDGELAGVYNKTTGEMREAEWVED